MFVIFRYGVYTDDNAMEYELLVAHIKHGEFCRKT
jgi:hypothetical protein